jgi:anaerobic nitric oxide reductase flavorubredoxin
MIERNRMNWNFIESVEFEGAPKEEDLAKVEAGILELLEKMRDKVVE